MSDNKRNRGFGPRGRRGGYAARQARWADFPAWMGAGVFTTAESFSLPSWTPFEAVRLWLARPAGGHPVLTRHRLTLDPVTGETIVGSPDASWSPAIRHSLDRRRDPLATKVANALIKGSASAEIMDHPAAPWPLFGYADRPPVMDSPGLRFAAAKLHGLPRDAEISAEQLDAAWDGVHKLWVDNGQKLKIYPSRFVSADLRREVAADPVDGSPNPGDPGEPGEIRGGWVFARDRWVPRVPAFDAVYFDSRAVSGIAGLYNPMLKVVGPKGLGLFNESRSDLEADAAARERYAKFMDALISAEDPAEFDKVVAEVAKRLPGGYEFTGTDIAQAMFHPTDPATASTHPRPFYFLAENLAAESARWDYSAAVISAPAGQPVYAASE